MQDRVFVYRAILYKTIVIIQIATLSVPFKTPKSLVNYHTS